jgi:UDP-N-acetyl-D-galactosamine dehydrogenase
MGSFVASEIVKNMVQKDIPVKGAKTLLLGFAFKENCPDVRNTRVIDIYQDLKEFGLDITVYDPWVDRKEVHLEYGITVSNSKSIFETKFSVIILAVSHNEFCEIDLVKIKDKNSVLFDIKGFLPQNLVDARL